MMACSFGTARYARLPLAVNLRSRGPFCCARTESACGCPWRLMPCPARLSWPAGPATAVHGGQQSGSARDLAARSINYHLGVRRSHCHRAQVQCCLPCACACSARTHQPLPCARRLLPFPAWSSELGEIRRRLSGDSGVRVCAGGVCGQNRGRIRVEGVRLDLGWVYIRHENEKKIPRFRVGPTYP